MPKAAAKRRKRKNESGDMNLLDLPWEMLVAVAQRVSDWTSLVALAQTSQRLRSLAKSRSFWRSIHSMDLEDLPSVALPKEVPSIHHLHLRPPQSSDLNSRFFRNLLSRWSPSILASLRSLRLAVTWTDADGWASLGRLLASLRLHELALYDWRWGHIDCEATLFPFLHSLPCLRRFSVRLVGVTDYPYPHGTHMLYLFPTATELEELCLFGYQQRKGFCLDSNLRLLRTRRLRRIEVVAQPFPFQHPREVTAALDDFVTNYLSTSEVFISQEFDICRPGPHHLIVQAL